MKNTILSIFVFLFLHTSADDKVDFWGVTGHRTVGKIAENHLSKKAKRQIDKLLNGESLAFVSTYADEIKSDKNFNKFYSWHYVNMPLDATYAKAEKNPKGDIIAAIDTCITVLKNDTSSKEDKVFHLKMLVHFLGDLHQPLHIGRKEDKGGNDVKVKWFNRRTNLHSVWDTKMIEEWNMSYLELAKNAQRLSKNQIVAIQQGSVTDWVKEIHVLTKEVYDSAKEGENLSYRYSYDHFGTVRSQLQKGGIRLAKILNDIFG